MVKLGEFDATQVEPNSGFDPIPNGEYLCVITESSEELTKDGSGSYLKFVLELLEGEYKGRKLFVRLNTKNQSQQAVEIAYGQLSALCRAVNVPKPGDTAALHDIPFVAVVKCKKRKDTDEMANEVSGFKSKSDAAKKESATAASTGNATPPWVKKK